MKRVLLILLGLVAFCAIGVTVVVMRLDAQAIRDQAAAAVSSATGKPLVIQGIPQISLMPLGIKFGPVYWGMSPDGAPDPAGGISVAVQSGRISVQLLPLLSGKVLVNEVRLDGPDVHIRPEKNAPAANAAPPKAEASQAMPEPPVPPAIEVNRLRLTNASCSLETAPGQTVRLSGLDMELDNVRLGAEMRLNLAARLAVSAPVLEGALSFKAKLRLETQKYELRELALRFTPDKGILPASTGAIDLAAQAAYDFTGGKLQLPLLSLAAQGSKVELSGDADAKTQAFTGMFKVDSAPRKLMSALGVSLPFKKGLESFRLQSPVALAGRTLSLHAIQGMLDTTALDGKLSLDMVRMYAAGNLNLGALDLDALMASAPGVFASESAAMFLSPAEAQAAQARTTPSQPASGALKTQNSSAAGLPAVDLDLACTLLTVSRLQFKDIRAKARGRGIYRIEPLTLNLGTGGSVNLKLSADASAMRYTAAGKVSNVAVGPLLQAMQGKRPVEGTANLDLDNIACAGTNAKAVQESLSGKGLLTVRGIVLNDVSILPKDAPAGIGKAPTHFEQLNVPFTSAAGIVNLAPVTLTSPTANVKGQGVVRLPQENLDFTADVSVLKVTVPVQLSGSFSDPSYGLDGKRIMNTLTKTPGALVEGAAQKTGSAVEGAGQKAGGAVQGAKESLKGVFGR